MPITSPLYTDFYQLTMAQGYFLSGRHELPAQFDYFFRKNPFGGGYTIFAGLADLVDFVSQAGFAPQELEYLESLGFDPAFLQYLEQFRFGVDMESVPEGSVVFPNEPILSVHGPLIAAQILETVLLNVLNFESLIATKAARIRQVAGERLLADFGLRRAQGLGGYHASRAAVIGGCDATSNVLAAHTFGLQPSGTLAHAWVQSFDSELEAFRTYAQYYPEHTVLLVDTYDTLGSGLPHAITVGREMAERGYSLRGIRLDSGDLAYLSRKARQMLDEAGLKEVKILASNQLDEQVIRSLIEQQAPIDGFGVGTQLITGQPTAALDGVYKLSWCDGKDRMKKAENPEKQTLPGKKLLLRYFDENGQFYRDGVFSASKGEEPVIYAPHQPDLFTRVEHLQGVAIRQEIVKNGESKLEPQSISALKSFCREEIQKLPPEHRRLENPHLYKVGVGQEILNSIATLTRQNKT